MDTVGLILTLLGGVFLVAAALGLAFIKGDEETAAGVLVDAILFAGIFSFIRGFARGVSDAFTNRKSSSFVCFILFCVGAIMLAIGLYL